MKRIAIGLIVLALAVGVANAVRPVEETAVIAVDDASPARPPIYWFDDMEGGDNGWTHGDFTATGGPPRFHIDTYMAYGGEGHSWWCGTFDYDADGGYGNNWYEYLNIPPTDISSAGGYAVLTFAVRYDSEAMYDFTHVQQQMYGVWTDFDAWEGYSGYGAWDDNGFVCNGDNPFMGRFLFVSDGEWSDADGHSSVGGGFACDNVKLFDYYNGTVFFYDDAESGGLCTPGHPGASGDWWHRRYDDCSSYSGHYSWWCGDDADTSLIPPLLQNWLDTPWIDIHTAYDYCLLRTMVHFEVPTVDDDYLARYVTYDGVTYYQLNASWGDFGTCSGWSGSYWTTGKQLDMLTPWPQDRLQVSHVFHTTANGCGPGAGGGAGITIDNVQVEGRWVPVEERSWGGIKAMYR
jgi:hypothetical protein